MKTETSNLNGYFAISEAEYNEYQELKKKVGSVDYDRLRVGSVVMIKYNGKQIFADITDLTKPVTVLMKGESVIGRDGNFIKESSYRKNIVFIQDGKLSSFCATQGLEFITEVISY